MNVNLKMMSTKENTYQCQFQIKVDFVLKGDTLKKVLQKLSLSIWNRLSKEKVERNNLENKEQDEDKIYVMTNLDIFRYETNNNNDFYK